MSLVEPSRWAFTVATPAGDVRSTYLLTADALEFDSDALWEGGHVTVPWTVIVEAGTAKVDMPVGRGAPDLGRFVPGKIEWLMASRSDAPGKPFMRPLPPAPDRDAVIAGVRERLGARWIGEGIPLLDARQRFGARSGGEGLKAAGIVLGVLALLALLLILLMLLLSPVFLFPAGFALAAWLLRRGLSGVRDAASAASTTTARVGSAALGFVKLEGLARTAHPTPAAVTGRPSVWWDVTVQAYSVDGDRHGTWRQLAARHGGTVGVLELEDQTGRVPVWVKDADLLLATESWETGRDRLPAPGLALLEELGFPWQGALRVTETRLELDAPVYVLGTLDRRRAIADLGEDGLSARLATTIRTGEWRTRLIRVLPRWLGLLVAVLAGFLGIVTGVGRGGERVKGAQDSVAPDLPPDAVLVWKGRTGRPFIVSNGREAQALTQLRSRSLYSCAAGAGVLCYCLYELWQLF